jgi:hypothetical protein
MEYVTLLLTRVKRNGRYRACGYLCKSPTGTALLVLQVLVCLRAAIRDSCEMTNRESLGFCPDADV